MQGKLVDYNVVSLKIFRLQIIQIKNQNLITILNKYLDHRPHAYEQRHDGHRDRDEKSEGKSG